MTTQKTFKDTSIFQGVKQFTTNSGEEVRAEKDLFLEGIWKISIFNKLASAYIYEAHINTDSKSPSCKTIWKIYKGI